MLQNVIDFMQEFPSQMCTAGKFIDFLSGGRKRGQVGKISTFMGKKCLGFINSVNLSENCMTCILSDE